MNNADYLVSIIIGDKKSNYDGKIISRSYNNNYLEKIKKIRDILSIIDYDLNFKSSDELNDIIFNLVLQGHIIFLNLGNGIKKIGCLYLPFEITENQLKTLKSLKVQLTDFELLKFTINKNDMESFKIIDDNFKTKKMRKSN